MDQRRSEISKMPENPKCCILIQNCQISQNQQERLQAADKIPGKGDFDPPHPPTVGQEADVLIFENARKKRQQDSEHCFPQNRTFL